MASECYLQIKHSEIAILQICYLASEFRCSARNTQTSAEKIRFSLAIRIFGTKPAKYFIIQLAKSERFYQLFSATRSHWRVLTVPYARDFVILKSHFLCDFFPISITFKYYFVWSCNNLSVILVILARDFLWFCDFRLRFFCDFMGVRWKNQWFTPGTVPKFLFAEYSETRTRVM